MKNDPLKKIRPAMNQLARDGQLQWAVSWLCGGHWNVTCSILSDPFQRRHQIEVYPEAAKDWRFWRTQVAHEVCHGWLAERVDPAFACMRFLRAYGELQGAGQAEFTRRAGAAYRAYILVDVWVNELRHRFWPDMTAVANNGFTSSVIALTKRGQLGQGDHLIALAQDIAERRRLNQPTVDYSPAFATLEQETAQAVQALADFYTALPNLSYQYDADIEILRQAVVGASQLLQLPFMPELVMEDNTWVWKVM